MTPDSPTTPDTLAAILAGTLVFLILSGSLMSWGIWLLGVRPNRIAKRPQATVGLVDILITIVLLIGLMGFSLLIWNGIRPRSVVKNPSVAAAMELSTEDSRTEDSRTEDGQTEDGQTEDGQTDDRRTGDNNTGEKPPDTNPTKDKRTESSKRNRTSDSSAGKAISEEQFVFSAVAMSAQLLCVVLATYFIRFRTGVPLRFLGWRKDQFFGDLLAGMQCFFMITPLLLALNAFLIHWTGVPYEHPIQQMLQKYPWMLGIAFWQASIVAPISEEFGFRSLLIGWFESIHFGKNKMESTVLGHHSHDEIARTSLETSSENSEAEINLSEAARPTASDYSPPWWPALLSGALFGLAHFSFGVSWLSLVIFGVILGRLYQWRQSLVPVVLVHFLFNTMSILFMGLKLWLPNPS